MGRFLFISAFAIVLGAPLGGCGDTGSIDSDDKPDASRSDLDGGMPGPRNDAGPLAQGDDGSVDAGTLPDGGRSGADSGVAPFRGCEGSTEAHRVFNEFWRFFDAEYALFDIRLAGSDWYTVGRDACSFIDRTVEESGEFTEAQLFTLMVDLAEQLDDGHVYIDAFSIDDADDGWVNEYPYYDELDELEGNVEFEYLDQNEFTVDAYFEFSWGTINDDVGYISITALSELSPLADPNATDQDDHSIDEQAADAAMNRFMSDMDGAGVDSIIVDIRANGGGWDTVALVVAEWFAGDRTVAWSEQRRSGPGHLDFGPWEDTFVGDAKPGAFGGPTILLTSGGTFSAAEVMMLTMRVRDNVTILGERSSGHLSDQLLTTLSNGWEIDLSHERYRAADGNIYEAVGVPVDVEVPLDVAALNRGTDAMLEAALARLGHPWNE